MVDAASGVLGHRRRALAGRLDRPEPLIRGGHPPTPRRPPLARPASGRSSLGKAEIVPLVDRHTDLLDGPASAVVPEPPAAVAGDSERLVDRVGVPLPGAGAEDRVGGGALPAGDPVARARQAAPARVAVPEAPS